MKYDRIFLMIEWNKYSLIMTSKLMTGHPVSTSSLFCVSIITRKAVQCINVASFSI